MTPDEVTALDEQASECSRYIQYMIGDLIFKTCAGSIPVHRHCL
jgi:hypothetical protein